MATFFASIIFFALALLKDIEGVKREYKTKEDVRIAKVLFFASLFFLFITALSQIKFLI